MSDTNKMPYDPIPVGGPFGIAPEAKPAFSRTTTEPVGTGGLLPPTRKPVAVTNSENSLPPGIAPESPTPPIATPLSGGGLFGLMWDVMKPTRAKGAVVAGLLSLGAGAYGLNLVVPQPELPPAKVMSEPGKETVTARMPSMILERGSTPIVEQLRYESILPVAATEVAKDLPLPTPGKLPDLSSTMTDTALPLVPPATPATDLPVPKQDIAMPLPKLDDRPLKEASTLPQPKSDLQLPPVGEALKMPPFPTPKETLTAPAPSETIPLLPKPTATLPVIQPEISKPDNVIKPIPPAESPFKAVAMPMADPIPPATRPKLDEVKFTTPAGLTVPPSAPPAVKAESVSTPKTDYDEDIVRVRSGDTYTSLAKAHYEDDKYSAALKEYNRGLDIGLTREIQVPPLYVLKKLTKSSFDRFDPATRPVSSSTPVISGPVLDAPTVKTESDLDWNKPGAAKPKADYSVLTTERDGLTPKLIAKQLLGDAGEWRKLTNFRGERFGEEEGLPKGTEVRYPKLQADWR